MKYYKRFPDAALQGMAVLTLEQRGAYNSVIDLIYACDGIVDGKNDARIARAIAIDVRTWRAIKPQLIAAGKIWLDEAGLLHARRCDEVLIEADTTSDRQSKRSRKRWDLFEKHNRTNADTMQRSNANTNIDRERDKKKEGVPTDHALPPTWAPNSDHLMLADQLGLTPDQVANNAEEMKAWAWGNGRTRSNWDFMFSSWLRRKAKSHRKTGNGHAENKPSVLDVTQGLLRQIRNDGTLPDPSGNPVRMLSQERRK
jgi:uncharacterized protein YdaU (DUF1376 family)